MWWEQRKALCPFTLQGWGVHYPRLVLTPACVIYSGPKSFPDPRSLKRVQGAEIGAICSLCLQLFWSLRLLSGEEGWCLLNKVLLKCHLGGLGAADKHKAEYLCLWECWESQEKHHWVQAAELDLPANQKNWDYYSSLNIVSSEPGCSVFFFSSRYSTQKTWKMK